jgi:digeranylgeranylglycerophospholipid reductase
MYTGKIAAETAVDAISWGNVSKEVLGIYDTTWRTSPFGQSLYRNWQIKEYFITLSDKKLNALVQSAATLDLENFSTLNIIKELMKRNPWLIPELAMLKLGLG